MREALRKAIMKKSKLKSKYPKNKTNVSEKLKFFIKF